MSSATQAQALPRSAAVLRALVIVIGIATVASGAFQVFFPGVVLRFVAGPSDAMSRHFFGIVGMFMVLFGGLVLHTLADEARAPGSGQVALLWCLLQKLGASLAVVLGVGKGIFSPLALLVAGFDFVSAIVFWLYRQGRRATP